MCGIFFTLIKDSNFDLNQIDFVLLKKRGPDLFKTIQIPFSDDCKTNLIFSASVLSLRGSESFQVTQQPLICEQTGNILLWNGEIFESDLVKVESNENDGFKLLNKLKDYNFNIFKIIESIKGPYSFIFYNKIENMIYFGRDRFGRRSLLISKDENGSRFTLSSVRTNFLNKKIEYQELKANGVYTLDLNSDLINLNLIKWNEQNEIQSELNNYIKNMNILISDIKLFDSISKFNDDLSEDFVADKMIDDYLIDKFYNHLKNSVKKRVENVPNFCKKCSHINSTKSVKFNSLNQLESIKCPHAKIGILFSGGVDSTVLAALADECIPKNEPIDLLNIAFEKQKSSTLINKKLKNDEEEEEDEFDLKNLGNIYLNDEFLVPDRLSGIESLKELNPERKWNFIEINIKLDELRKERENLIKHLLYPHQTVLDDSIGCALWFASRGKGFIRDKNGDKIEYISNAEILLLGMGADEQLGGYARHRTRYEKYGIQSFCDELKMEMKRISERNLGRDDRILSDHGKESRLPYLDENVVSFLNELKLNEKCNLKFEKGFGEKLLLRRMAEIKFGLKFSSRLKKRAIQFGSRVAKIENVKEKANDICNRIMIN